MSVAEALSRVTAIQARIATIAPRPAPPPSPPTPTFGAMLQGEAAIGGAGLVPVGAGGASLGEPSQFDALIVQAAQEAGVPPALVKAVAKAESGFNPGAVSPAGASGLMQLMPGTARGLGVTDPFDPLQSLRGGARYLRAQLDRFGGDPSLALAAYNAGPGAVAKYGGIPPYAETQAYVPRVLGYFQQFGGASATAAPAATPGASPAFGAEAALPFTLAGGASVGGEVVRRGMEHLGTPYVWGGEQPGGFDCSGLAQYLYGQQGVQMPRVSQDQFRAGRSVPTNQMQPGDLVFFSKNGDVHHMGIYIGGGRFLHAPRTGDVVKISALSEPHYAREFAGARRYA